MHGLVNYSGEGEVAVIFMGVVFIEMFKYEIVLVTFSALLPIGFNIIFDFELEFSN